MYSRYLLLSTLLVVGAEAYAYDNNEKVGINARPQDKASKDSVFSTDSVLKNKVLKEVDIVARKAGTSRLAGAV